MAGKTADDLFMLANNYVAHANQNYRFISMPRRNFVIAIVGGCLRLSEGWGGGEGSSKGCLVFSGGYLRHCLGVVLVGERAREPEGKRGLF